MHRTRIDGDSRSTLENICRIAQERLSAAAVEWRKLENVPAPPMTKHADGSIDMGYPTGLAAAMLAVQFEQQATRPRASRGSSEAPRIS